MGKEQLLHEEALNKKEFFSLEKEWLRRNKNKVYKITNAWEKVKKE